MKKCFFMLVVFLTVLVISIISENNTIPDTEDVMAINNTKDFIYVRD
ncbi:hypothetical protein [Aurantibacter sp.]